MFSSFVYISKIRDPNELLNFSGWGETQSTSYVGYYLAYRTSTG
jgi:hypothetical protein